MKFLRPIIFFLNVMALTSCLSMTQNRIPSSYDTMSLYKGYYVREGDPYTGKGYVQEGCNANFQNSGQGYIIQYGDDKIIPLRKNEVIRRIVIMPKKQGDIRVPRSYIIMVVKNAAWAE